VTLSQVNIASDIFRH